MKRLILLLIIVTGVVTGYSQDTIVTAKKVYVGKIVSSNGDGFFTITSDVDVMSRYRNIHFSRIIEMKTTNEEIYKLFENYIYINSKEYEETIVKTKPDKTPNISESTIKIHSYSAKSKHNTPYEVIKDEFSKEYNFTLRTFNKFNAQRKGGKAAMIGGGIVTVAGGIMAGVGGYQAKPGLAIAGGVVAGAGGLSFLVGLFCWIDGQDKMFNAKNELNIIKLKRSIISGDISPTGAKVSLSF